TKSNSGPITEVTDELSARSCDPPHPYMKNAPTAQKFSDQRCKRTFATVSATSRLMHCGKIGMLCGAFNAHIDFATERPEVDWFGQQRLSTVLQSLAFRLGVAVGGNHDDRDIRPQCLGLGQEFKTAHPRHVDVGED